MGWHGQRSSAADGHAAAHPLAALMATDMAIGLPPEVRQPADTASPLDPSIGGTRDTCHAPPAPQLHPWCIENRADKHSPPGHAATVQGPVPTVDIDKAVLQLVVAGLAGRAVETVIRQPWRQPPCTTAPWWAWPFSPLLRGACTGPRSAAGRWAGPVRSGRAPWCRSPGRR